MGDKTRSSSGTTKLFVGNLRAGCKRRDLLNLFESFGCVKECDIIKNYAFVHYENREEAQAAVAALDNSDFQGSTVRVEMSTSRGRQSSAGDQGGGDTPNNSYTMPPRYPPSSTKLFVGNLPDDCVSDDLRAVFSIYGRVTECDIIKNYAFIHFEDVEQARHALELDDSEFQGSKIRVELSTGRGRQARAEQPSCTKLFVGNLSEDCSHKDLLDLFEVHGEVTECDIIKNYAFVHFRSGNDALAAVSALDQSNFYDNQIRVQLSTSQSRSAPGASKVIATKLFVGNVPDKCKRKDLLAAFEKFGKVTECDIIKQYAFVHYENGVEANAAVRAMDDSTFMGSRIKVELSTCKTRAQSGKSTCFRCGKEGHWSKDCRMPGHNSHPQPSPYALPSNNAAYAGSHNATSPDVFSTPAVCMPAGQLASSQLGPYGRLRDPYAQDVHDYRGDRPYVAIDRFRPYEDPYERRVHTAAGGLPPQCPPGPPPPRNDGYYAPPEKDAPYMRGPHELYIVRRSPPREFYSLYGGDAIGVSAAPAPPRY